MIRMVREIAWMAVRLIALAGALSVILGALQEWLS